MNKTSDGIPGADWERMQELAVTYANCLNAGDTDNARKTKRRIHAFLNVLRTKLGDRPSILATKSDYLENKRARETLLLRAYTLARRAKDTKNLTLVASSLAELYVREFGDESNGRLWISRLGDALQDYPDRDEENLFKELSKEIRLQY